MELEGLKKDLMYPVNSVQWQCDIHVIDKIVMERGQTVIQLSSYTCPHFFCDHILYNLSFLT